MEDLIAKLLAGNNPLLILLALFLFKDQIFSIFKPKPAVPAVPAEPAPTPAVPSDRPVLNIVKDLLPVLLPLLLPALTPVITQLVKEQTAKDQPK